MITVYKYRIEVGGETLLRLPQGAGLLHFSYVPKDDAWFLWALVDTRRPTEIRTLRLYGTGFEIDQFCMYVGTGMTPSGNFVLHLFEVKK